MMKIVNVEDFFHPEAGYQLNVLSRYLKVFGNEVVIITAEMQKIPAVLTDFFETHDIEGKDLQFTKDTGVKIKRLPIVCYKSGRALLWKNLLRTIQKENPDVLYIHGESSFTAMYLLLLRKKMRCPIVMDSHMVDMATINRFSGIFRKFYRMIFAPIIIKEKIPVIRTADTDFVERRMGIPLSQAPLISFGSDLLLFHPDEKRKIDFRKKESISQDAFVIIYAGKLDDGKGGLFLAKALLEKFTTDREVVFLIVGNAVKERKKEIENTFMKSENRIIRFPTQKYKDLPIYFQSADLALFPKQCSLSFFDVQACSVPVLFENNEINQTRCIYDNAWMFKKDSVLDFRNKIEQIISIPISEYAKNKNAAYKYIKNNYSYEDRAREYEAVLIKQYQEYNANEIIRNK